MNSNSYDVSEEILHSMMDNGCIMHAQASVMPDLTKAVQDSDINELKTYNKQPDSIAHELAAEVVMQYLELHKFDASIETGITESNGDLRRKYDNDYLGQCLQLNGKKNLVMQLAEMREAEDTTLPPSTMLPEITDIIEQILIPSKRLPRPPSDSDDEYDGEDLTLATTISSFEMDPHQKRALEDRLLREAERMERERMAREEKERTRQERRLEHDARVRERQLMLEEQEDYSTYSTTDSPELVDAEVMAGNSRLNGHSTMVVEEEEEYYEEEDVYESRFSNTDSINSSDLIRTTMSSSRRGSTSRRSRSRKITMNPELTSIQGSKSSGTQSTEGSAYPGGGTRSGSSTSQTSTHTRSSATNRGSSTSNTQSRSRTNGDEPTLETDYPGRFTTSTDGSDSRYSYSYSEERSSQYPGSQGSRSTPGLSRGGTTTTTRPRSVTDGTSQDSDNSRGPRLPFPKDKSSRNNQSSQSGSYEEPSLESSYPGNLSKTNQSQDFEDPLVKSGAVITYGGQKTTDSYSTSTYSYDMYSNKQSYENSSFSSNMKPISDSMIESEVTSNVSYSESLQNTNNLPTSDYMINGSYSNTNSGEKVTSSPKSDNSNEQKFQQRNTYSTSDIDKYDDYSRSQKSDNYSKSDTYSKSDSYRSSSTDYTYQTVSVDQNGQIVSPLTASLVETKNSSDIDGSDFTYETITVDSQGNPMHPIDSLPPPSSTFGNDYSYDGPTTATKLQEAFAKPSVDSEKSNSTKIDSDEENSESEFTYETITVDSQGRIVTDLTKPKSDTYENKFGKKDQDDTTEFTYETITVDSQGNPINRDGSNVPLISDYTTNVIHKDANGNIKGPGDKTLKPAELLTSTLDEDISVSTTNDTNSYSNTKSEINPKSDKDFNSNKSDITKSDNYSKDGSNGSETFDSTKSSNKSQNVRNRNAQIGDGKLASLYATKTDNNNSNIDSEESGEYTYETITIDPITGLPKVPPQENAFEKLMNEEVEKQKSKQKENPEVTFIPDWAQKFIPEQQGKFVPNRYIDGTIANNDDDFTYATIEIDNKTGKPIINDERIEKEVEKYMNQSKSDSDEEYTYATVSIDENGHIPVLDKLKEKGIDTNSYSKTTDSNQNRFLDQNKNNDKFMDQNKKIAGEDMLESTFSLSTENSEPSKSDEFTKSNEFSKSDKESKNSKSSNRRTRGRRTKDNSTTSYTVSEQSLGRPMTALEKAISMKQKTVSDESSTADYSNEFTYATVTLDETGKPIIPDEIKRSIERQNKAEELSQKKYQREFPKRSTISQQQNDSEESQSIDASSSEWSQMTKPIKSKESKDSRKNFMKNLTPSENSGSGVKTFNDRRQKPNWEDMVNGQEIKTTDSESEIPSQQEHLPKPSNKFIKSKQNESESLESEPEQTFSTNTKLTTETAPKSRFAQVEESTDTVIDTVTTYDTNNDSSDFANFKEKNQKDPSKRFIQQPKSSSKSNDSSEKSDKSEVKRNSLAKAISSKPPGKMASLDESMMESMLNSSNTYSGDFTYESVSVDSQIQNKLNQMTINKPETDKYSNKSPEEIEKMQRYKLPSNESKFKERNQPKDWESMNKNDTISESYSESTKDSETSETDFMRLVKGKLPKIKDNLVKSETESENDEKPKKKFAEVESSFSDNDSYTYASVSVSPEQAQKLGITEKTGTAVKLPSRFAQQQKQQNESETDEELSTWEKLKRSANRNNSTIDSESSEEPKNFSVNPSVINPSQNSIDDYIRQPKQRKLEAEKRRQRRKVTTTDESELIDDVSTSENKNLVNAFKKEKEADNEPSLDLSQSSSTKDSENDYVDNVIINVGPDGTMFRQTFDGKRADKSEVANLPKYTPKDLENYHPPTSRGVYGQSRDKRKDASAWDKMNANKIDSEPFYEGKEEEKPKIDRRLAPPKDETDKTYTYESVSVDSENLERLKQLNQMKSDSEKPKSPTNKSQKSPVKSDVSSESDVSNSDFKLTQNQKSKLPPPPQFATESDSYIDSSSTNDEKQNNEKSFTASTKSDMKSDTKTKPTHEYTYTSVIPNTKEIDNVKSQMSRAPQQETTYTYMSVDPTTKEMDNISSKSPLLAAFSMKQKTDSTETTNTDTYTYQTEEDNTSQRNTRRSIPEYKSKEDETQKNRFTSQQKPQNKEGKQNPTVLAAILGQKPTKQQQQNNSTIESSDSEAESVDFSRKQRQNNPSLDLSSDIYKENTYSYTYSTAESTPKQSPKQNPVEKEEKSVPERFTQQKYVPPQYKSKAPANLNLLSGEDDLSLSNYGYSTSEYSEKPSTKSEYSYQSAEEEREVPRGSKIESPNKPSEKIEEKENKPEEQSYTYTTESTQEEEQQHWQPRFAEGRKKLPEPKKESRFGKKDEKSDSNIDSSSQPFDFDKNYRKIESSTPEQNQPQERRRRRTNTKTESEVSTQPDPRYTDSRKQVPPNSRSYGSHSTIETETATWDDEQTFSSSYLPRKETDNNKLPSKVSNDNLPSKVSNNNMPSKVAQNRSNLPSKVSENVPQEKTNNLPSKMTNIPQERTRNIRNNQRNVRHPTISYESTAEYNTDSAEYDQYLPRKPQNNEGSPVQRQKPLEQEKDKGKLTNIFGKDKFPEPNSSTFDPYNPFADIPTYDSSPEPKKEEKPQQTRRNTRQRRIDPDFKPTPANQLKPNEYTKPFNKSNNNLPEKQEQTQQIQSRQTRQPTISSPRNNNINQQKQPQNNNMNQNSTTTSIDTISETKQSQQKQTQQKPYQYQEIKPQTIPNQTYTNTNTNTIQSQENKDNKSISSVQKEAEKVPEKEEIIKQKVPRRLRGRTQTSSSNTNTQEENTQKNTIKSETNSESTFPTVEDILSPPQKPKQVSKFAAVPETNEVQSGSTIIDSVTNSQQTNHSEDFIEVSHDESQKSNQSEEEESEQESYEESEQENQKDTDTKTYTYTYESVEEPIRKTSLMPTRQKEESDDSKYIYKIPAQPPITEFRRVPQPFSKFMANQKETSAIDTPNTTYTYGTSSSMTTTLKLAQLPDDGPLMPIPIKKN